MALEDIESAGKYIDALDKNNPIGLTDAKNQGDNHIRGVKNVLLLSFPNITGAMTVTHGDLNGFFTTGNKMVFFQAAAPTGWTQDTTSAADNKMLRIVNSAGGGSGGSDSPITHLHTTGNFTLNTSHLSSHRHSIGLEDFAVQSGVGATAVRTSGSMNTDFQGGGASHNHGDTSSYSPKYADMILCSKN